MAKGRNVFAIAWALTLAALACGTGSQSGPSSGSSSGNGARRIWNDARVGAVESVGAVTILHRANVSGNVVSAGSVSKSADATVSGTVSMNKPVTLPSIPTLPVFPPATAPFTVNSGARVTLAPGSYTTGNVNGGTLVLGAGDYFMTSFTVNSGSTVP